MATPRPVIVTSDADLMEDLLRLAAAAGVEVQVAHDTQAARRQWRSAPLVVMDLPSARAIARDVGRREGVLVVCRDADPDAWQTAVEVGAEHVVRLPDAERWLVGRLADGGEGPSRDGRVLCVTGSVGGAGASTLATSLALLAARRERVLLVDLDPSGGGLDLVLGAEHATGARWPDLLQARGRVNAGALASALPCVDGVFLLSSARDGQEAIDETVLAAVLDAGVRGFDLVIVDAPVRSPHLPAVTARADRVVLVVPNHTRAVMAACECLTALGGLEVDVVMRADPEGLTESALTCALDRDAVATVPWHRSLSSRADDGASPLSRDGYTRACAGLLDRLSVTGARAA